jgi:hypothetical protein
MKSAIRYPACFRYLTLLALAAFPRCAAHNGDYAFSKVEGRKVGSLAYTAPEELLKDLRESGRDETDIAIESKMIPHGGIIKVKDNVYYSTNPIVRLSIDDGTGPMDCDDAEVDDAGVPLGGPAPGAFLAPSFRIEKTKTAIECKVKRKLRYPARISFIGVKGDTVSRYEIGPAGKP